MRAAGRKGCGQKGSKFYRLPMRSRIRTFRASSGAVAYADRAAEPSRSAAALRGPF